MRLTALNKSSTQPRSDNKNNNVQAIVLSNHARLPTSGGRWRSTASATASHRSCLMFVIKASNGRLATAYTSVPFVPNAGGSGRGAVYAPPGTCWLNDLYDGSSLSAFRAYNVANLGHSIFDPCSRGRRSAARTTSSSTASRTARRAPTASRAIRGGVYVPGPHRRRPDAVRRRRRMVPGRDRSLETFLFPGGPKAAGPALRAWGLMSRARPGSKSLTKSEGTFSLFVVGLRPSGCSLGSPHERQQLDQKRGCSALALDPCHRMHGMQGNVPIRPDAASTDASAGNS